MVEFRPGSGNLSYAEKRAGETVEPAGMIDEMCSNELTKVPVPN
jgi:hypothetical protein